MKKIIFRHTFLIVLSIVFISCEGNTDRVWKIYNNTTSSVKIELVRSLDNSAFVDVVTPFAEIEIAQTSQLGGSPTAQQPNSLLLFLNPF